MFWFLFVDWNAQSKLAGEYYVKSFMKTICAIICTKWCVCITCIWFLLQSGQGGEEGEEEGVTEVAVAIHHKEIYWVQGRWC